MSDGRPFFSQAKTWERSSGYSWLRRAYHSSPVPDPLSYISGNRVIWTMIGLNTAVFGAWQYAQATKDFKLLRQLQAHATLSQENLDAGRWWTFLTSAFSHQAPGHFIFNMFALGTFGKLVSMFGVGGRKVLMLAVGSACAGSFAWHYQQAPTSSFKQQKQNPDIWRHAGLRGSHDRVITITKKMALGASGMVQGIAAAATLLAPVAPIYLMFIPVPIPLFVVTIGYVAYDTYNLDSKTSRIGHSAHLGGFAFGVLYYFLSLRRFGGVWHMLARRLRR